LSGLGMNAIQDLHKLIRLFFKLKIKKKTCNYLCVKSEDRIEGVTRHSVVTCCARDAREPCV
jgi:hypothetical protein